ncbi:Inhibitor of trypsin and hageman factor-like protein [Drosera capensis]
MTTMTPKSKTQKNIIGFYIGLVVLRIAYPYYSGVLDLTLFKGMEDIFNATSEIFYDHVKDMIENVVMQGSVTSEFNTTIRDKVYKIDTNTLGVTFRLNASDITKMSDKFMSQDTSTDQVSTTHLNVICAIVTKTQADWATILMGLLMKHIEDIGKHPTYRRCFGRILDVQNTLKIQGNKRILRLLHNELRRQQVKLRQDGDDRRTILNWFGQWNVKKTGIKFRWPELVGHDGLLAKKTIESQNPKVTALIIHQGEFGPNIFCCNRVWVIVNGNGIVIAAPKIG